MMYESMKPSGTAWLGNIPATWDCKKIGSLFTQRKVKVSDKDYPALSVSKIGVTPQLETAVKTDNGDNRKLVKTGDFVINSRSDRKGSCGVSALDGSVSLINIVLKPRQEWNERYVHYLLRSQPFSEEYYHYGRGIVADLWTTRYSEMKNILLPIPPRAEQDQIVRYLDWQVSKINKLISTKKKKIELLREQKRNMVSSIVFHGIDSTVDKGSIPLKFVDWIPAHWNAIRGKYLFSEHDIRSETGEEELLSVSHITGVTPRSQKNVTMFKAESLVGYKVCDVHDIAANIKWMWQGAIAVSQYKGVISPSYCTLHQIEGAYEERYLDYLLRAKPMVDEYLRLSTGIRKSRLRLYPDQFLAMYFPVPPFEEQSRIADYIEEKAKGIDELIAKTEKQISIISELKTRCIADVATGQIDVRGIEIPEYEYEEDTIDDEIMEDEEDTNDESDF